MESSRVIVYFDGVCGLCNRFVDFLLKHDKRKSLKLAPLQNTQENINTIVLSIDGQEYYKSEAAIKAIASLKGPWTLVLLFLVIPKFFRDAIYDWVARSRYTLFGKRDTCRIPTPDEKDRFLE